MYTGWIPTVGARLSFSVIGTTLHPTRAVRANCADSKNRYIIAFQKRPLSDSALPFFQEPLTRIYSTFWFVMVAQASNCPTEADGTLSGEIYVFDDKKKWQEDVIENIKSAQRELERYEENGHQTPIKNYYQNGVKIHLSSLEENSSFHIKFELKRNGVVQINLPIETAAIKQLDLKAKNIETLVCSQAFFFLKDMAHAHQHHIK